MNLEDAIESVWRHTQAGVHFPKEWEGKLSQREAYDVQLGLLNRYVAAGATHVGWKVGLTSKATQSQFGLYERIFGLLLRRGANPSGTPFATSELIRPGVEPELCSTVGTTHQWPGGTLDPDRAALCATRAARDSA